MRRTLVAVLAVGALIIFGSLGFSGVLSNRTTITTFTSHPLCLNPSSQGPFSEGGEFTVKVSFRGQWNATVSTYSALDTNPAYIHTAKCYYGTGNASMYVVPWNSGGEQTVVVIAQKLDPSHDNLTASVTWGAAIRTNNTISPYGSVTVSIGTVP